MFCFEVLCFKTAQTAVLYKSDKNKLPVSACRDPDTIKLKKNLAVYPAATGTEEQHTLDTSSIARLVSGCRGRAVKQGGSGHDCYTPFIPVKVDCLFYRHRLCLRSTPVSD